MPTFKTVNIQQLWNVTKYINPSTVLKYTFKVLVLYLSLFFSCHFLLLLHYISERNIYIFLVHCINLTALVTSYFTNEDFCTQNMLFINMNYYKLNYPTIYRPTCPAEMIRPLNT